MQIPIYPSTYNVNIPNNDRSESEELIKKNKYLNIISYKKSAQQTEGQKS